VRQTSRYSLRQVPDGYELVRDGAGVPAAVESEILEAEQELEDGRQLVWLTEASPYEEGLHVYLLSAAGEILDEIEAGADFAPGILRIEALGSSSVHFTFFKNDVRYRLDVAPRPKLFRPLPTGWRYKRRFRRHFLVVRPDRKKVPLR
jgi:hypothetical protein